MPSKGARRPDTQKPTRPKRDSDYGSAAPPEPIPAKSPAGLPPGFNLDYTSLEVGDEVMYYSTKQSRWFPAKITTKTSTGVKIDIKQGVFLPFSEYGARLAKKGGPMIWLTKTTTTTRSAIIDMYAYTPASSSGSPTEALNVCLYSSLTWLGLGLGLGLGRVWV